MMFTLGNLQDIGKFVLVPVSHEDPELTSISQISRSCGALPHTHPSSYEKTAVAHNTPASRVVYKRLPLRIEKAGLLGWEAGRGYRDSRRRRYERAAYLVDTNQVRLPCLTLASCSRLYPQCSSSHLDSAWPPSRSCTHPRMVSPHPLVARTAGNLPRRRSLLLTPKPWQKAANPLHASDVANRASHRLARPRSHSYACASRSTSTPPARASRARGNKSDGRGTRRRAWGFDSGAGDVGM